MQIALPLSYHSHKENFTMNWNQFLSACKTAWSTEGQQESRVHSYLLRCEKTPSMTLVQVAASAYKLYKSEN